MKVIYLEENWNGTRQHDKQFSIKDDYLGEGRPQSREVSVQRENVSINLKQLFQSLLWNTREKGETVDRKDLTLNCFIERLATHKYMDTCS